MIKHPRFGDKDFLFENLKFRVAMLAAAEEDKEMQAAIVKECRESPLFFFNVLAWTYNPKKIGTLSGPHLPFCTYPYQDEGILDIVGFVEAGEDAWVEKSREMGWSWVLVGIQLWGFIFREWASLYGSYKQDYVDKSGDMDSHFERIRYMLDRLPSWIIPEDLVRNFMSITSKEIASGMAGDSGANFGTGGRRKLVAMDEFALWAEAAKAIRKTRDVSPCRLIGGTPEGKFNEYGKAMTGHKDYAHQKINKITWHWTLHPEKAAGAYIVGLEGRKLTTDEAFQAWKDGKDVTSPWYEIEKTKRSADDLAREVDISYTSSVRGRVYPEFESVVKVGRFKYNPNLPLYTAQDYGRDTTAILFIQRDFINNIDYVIDCYQKKSDGELIDFFASFIRGLPLGNYAYTNDELEKIASHFGWRYSQHFGDPYNVQQKSIVTNRTIADAYREEGIILNWITPRGKNQVHDRIQLAHQRLPKLCIDADNCQDFIASMMGCKFPDIKEGAQITSLRALPIHDDTSHFRTAFEYYCDNMAMVESPFESVLDSANVMPDGKII